MQATFKFYAELCYNMYFSFNIYCRDFQGHMYMRVDHPLIWRKCIDIVLCSISGFKEVCCPCDARALFLCIVLYKPSCLLYLTKVFGSPK